jgi:hypothetical protein
MAEAEMVAAGNAPLNKEIDGMTCLRLVVGRPAARSDEIDIVEAEDMLVMDFEGTAEELAEGTTVQTERQLAARHRPCMEEVQVLRFEMENDVEQRVDMLVEESSVRIELLAPADSADKALLCSA